MIKILINNVRFVNPTSLIKLLKRICKYNIEIWGTDSESRELNACSNFLDHYLICPKMFEEEKYLNFIIELNHNIKFDIIIPGSDLDVQFYSKNKEIFDAKVIIPEQKAVKLFYDKYLASLEMQKRGFLIPPIVENFFDEKKIIFRKKISSSSSGIYTCDLNNDQYIPNYFNNKYFAQQYIYGEEYTVDVFSDNKGNPKLILPRKRLKIKNGMSISCQICNNAKIIDTCKKIYSEFYIPGLSNVQFIVNENKVYFIELNMRFAGSGISGVAASFNYLELYIEHFLFGKELESLEYYMSKVAWDSIISRYYEESIYFPESNN